jgi:hypothetical protein
MDGDSGDATCEDEEEIVGVVDMCDDQLDPDESDESDVPPDRPPDLPPRSKRKKKGRAGPGKGDELNVMKMNSSDSTLSLPYCHLVGDDWMYAHPLVIIIRLDRGS